MRGGHFAAAVLLGRVDIVDAAGVVGAQVVGCQGQGFFGVLLHRAGLEGNGKEVGELQVQALQQGEQSVVLGGSGGNVFQQLNAFDERRFSPLLVLAVAEVQVVLRKRAP